ncbi:MAG: hypothetical protein Q7T55_25835 [Solirubrobacteraceae bacterium]|nr:hypothetical protein [Solirubrobacteraceae bacterium]
MAKIPLCKAPVALESGFGHWDATRGRDGGLCQVVVDTPQGLVYKEKTRAVRKRSPKQIARGQRYCDCDEKWKEMSIAKMQRVRKWYLWTYNLKSTNLSNYHIWMRVCLKGWLEGDLFFPFCWAGKYRYLNDTGEILPARRVWLLDVPWLDSEGTDNEVHQLRGLRMDDHPVPRIVIAPGTLEISGPSLQPGSYIEYMVYAYADL